MYSTAGVFLFFLVQMMFVNLKVGRVLSPDLTFPHSVLPDIFETKPQIREIITSQTQIIKKYIYKINLSMDI